MFSKSILSFAIAALMLNPCSAQLTNTQGGAVGGGTVGAIIGGIIGHQNDETPEGALIGGAVGAIAGGLLGKQKDYSEIQNYQYQQQQAYRAQQYARQQAEQQAIQFANGVSIADVIAMSQSGVGSTVVINQIQTNGVQQRIGVNEIISLHQNGVDSTVISVMQRAHLAGSRNAAPASPSIHDGSSGFSNGSVYSRPRPVVVTPRPVVVAPRPVVVTPRPAIVVSPRPGCGNTRPTQYRYASPRDSYYRR